MAHRAQRRAWVFIILVLGLPVEVGLSAEQAVVLQPQALEFVGIYDLKAQEPNLTGAGVTVGLVSRSITYLDGKPQNDYRPDTEHKSLTNARFSFYDDGQTQPGRSSHSTAICSILFGSDSEASASGLGSFAYQGITDSAEAKVYEFWHFLKEYVFGNKRPEVDIVSASIGSCFEDWWTRGLDALVEHHGLVVVAGIGNGTEAHDPPLYPAAGSNIIGVGVVDAVDSDDVLTSLSSFTLALPGVSSCGPTADKRCKPDIVAPGNCLVAGLSEPNSYQVSGSFSSFATPVVSGVAALLLQEAKAEPLLAEVLSEKSGNCVIKAVLMNSAKKLPYWHKGAVERYDDHEVPLDYSQGAGMVDALGAYRTLTAGRGQPGPVEPTGWDLNQLRGDQAYENIYRVTVDQPGTEVITVTTVWNRHFSTAYPFKAQPDKDADIRLELWAIDKDNRVYGHLLDYSDSAFDNVEHIHIACDPNYTDYEIIVTYSNRVAAQPAQSYGLAWQVQEKERSKGPQWYDLNGDGAADERDFVILLENRVKFLTNSEDYLIGDINDDGAIDLTDLNLLLEETKSVRTSD